MPQVCVKFSYKYRCSERDDHVAHLLVEWIIQYLQPLFRTHPAALVKPTTMHVTKDDCVMVEGACPIDLLGGIVDNMRACGLQQIHFETTPHDHEDPTYRTVTVTGRDEDDEEVVDASVTFRIEDRNPQQVTLQVSSASDLLVGS